MDISILAPVLAGGIRSLGGWFENAASDGKFSDIELKQLGATIIRVVIISAGLMLGLNAEPISASATAVILDFILMAVKKAGTKK